MTREEWLETLAASMREDRALMYASSWGFTPKFLSSFPSRATRRVVLGDLVRQTDSSSLALVSPLISSSLEVACVAYWLLVRFDYQMRDNRALTNRTNATILENAGFNAPFNQCIPTERLIDSIQTVVNRVVARIGEYPAADVNPEVRRTQTTRLLKMVCMNHYDDYILRMSRSQLDRGAPLCGICNFRMVEG